MSLEDKFYSSDTSPISRIDNFLIQSAAEVGKAYQHLTGRSYKDLVKAGYAVSTALASGGLASMDVLMIVSGFMASKEYDTLKKPRYTTPLQEEIGLEARGQNRTDLKARRLLRLTLGIYMAATALGSDIPHVKESLNKGDMREAISWMGYASVMLATLPSMFADYLSKSNLPTPPPKTVFARLRDTFKEMITIPMPLPVPVPVKYLESQEGM